MIAAEWQCGTHITTTGNTVGEAAPILEILRESGLEIIYRPILKPKKN